MERGRRRSGMVASAVAVGLALTLVGCAGGGGDSESAPPAVGGAAAPDREASGDDEASDGGFAQSREGSAASSNGSGQASTGGGESAADTAGQDPAGRIDPVGRSVIHRIDITVETEDVMGAARKSGQAAEDAGGFVESESTPDADDRAGRSSVSLVLRVPVERRGDLVATVESYGRVLARSRTAEDVTDQLVDVQSRVESQRRSIDRLRALLDDAANLRDVIAIETELTRREADLDSLLRRQEQLSRLAELATVTVTFAMPGTVEIEGADLGFLAGLRAGWGAFVQSLIVAVTIVGGVLPFVIAFALVGLPIWWAWRRQRRPRPGSDPA